MGGAFACYAFCMHHIVLEFAPQSTNHLYKPSQRGIYMTAPGKALKTMAGRPRPR